jgi:myo-inositol-1(or 4)-monophosphatase
MTKSQYFNLCNDVAAEIKIAVSGLIGKPEAGVTLKIGADGTPTEKIDQVAERQVNSIRERGTG